MDHSATMTTNADGFRQPVHVQCSCGTAGDFATQQIAADWITFQHFSQLGSNDTFSLTPNVLTDVKSPVPKPGQTYTPKLPVKAGA